MTNDHVSEPNVRDVTFSATVGPVDAESDAVDEAIRKQQAHLERELRGAWRAGYDYLHVYQENPMWNVPLANDPDKLADMVSTTEYYYPSDSKRPRLLEQDDVVYRCTYLLDVLPDALVRDAIEDGAMIPGRYGDAPEWGKE